MGKGRSRPEDSWAFASRAVRGAELRPPTEIPLSAPIYQTSTFAFEEADKYSQALQVPEDGYAYTRYSNPTVAALEDTVADLEGGEAGLATASGMAAITAVILGIASSGDHVVAQSDIYGGTYALLQRAVATLGLNVTFVDAMDLTAVEQALTPATRVLYVETIANPTLAVANLPELAARAHEVGAALVVDNTVASPFLCRPIEHGADVALHSATKYLGGHSDVVAGVAAFASAPLRRRAWRTMVDLGGSADPFAAWLVLRGIKTLPIRMQRHGENAARVAPWLAAHPKVERVYWPGRPDHATHDVARRILSGYGGMLSFDVVGGREPGRRVIESTRLARLAPSLGGVETLISHPASTTHRQLDAAALGRAGIGEGMIRLSVGLEDADDLIADLAQALATT